MAKYNIEHDLLKILKNKEGEEILYAIINMVNGTYKYEKKYLNRIPYNVLMIYLEKVIVLSTNYNQDLDDLDNCIKVLLNFVNNIEHIRFRDIDKISLTSIKYDLKIAQEKVKGTLKKSSTKKRIVCLILTGVLFFSFCNKAKSKGDGDLSNYIANEPTIENEEIIEMKQNIKATLLHYNTIIPELSVSNQQVEKEETKEISLDDKLSEIYSKYNLNEEEFNVLCAIAMTEAKTNSYEDTYAVINTIYNRTISQRWIDYISNYYGIENAGKSLYYQAIMPGQFVVYENGRYKMNLNVREGCQFDAVIDFLLNKEIKHDYLSFRSSDTEVSSYEQFVSDGNKYFDRLLADDRVIEEDITNIRS